MGKLQFERPSAKDRRSEMYMEFVWRAALGLFRDGGIGLEEAYEIVEASKPKVGRLPNGKIKMISFDFKKMRAMVEKHRSLPPL